jgi:O-antigen/teichoic acid export membrane protein
MMIKRGFHFFGVSASTAAAHNMDVMLLLSMQGPTAVGLYSAGAKLVKFTSYFSKAFNDALYPVLSKQAALSDATVLTRTFRGSAKWIIIVVVPPIAFASVQGTAIMEMLYGPGFTEAGFVFVVLAWRAGLAFLTQFCGNTLFAMERQGSVFKATGAGAIASVLLYAILIPHYGAAGAATGALAAFVIEFMLQFLALGQRLRSSFIRSFVGKPVLAGVAMGVVCASIKPIHLIPLACLGLVVYGVLIVLVGAITLQDVYTPLKSLLLSVQDRVARTRT